MGRNLAIVRQQGEIGMTTTAVNHSAAELRMRRAAARLIALCTLAGAAAVGSCTDINVAAGHVASLSFDSLPSPAVVAGDTLRDSLGRAAPLRAVAFNGSGDIIAQPDIQYISLDTGVTIGPGNFLVSQRRLGTVRLVANTATVQSAVRPLLVARQPDSVVVTGKLRDTLNYLLPDNATSNMTAALSVRVLTRDTTGGITSTQGWIVSYQAFHAGKAVAAGDTSSVFLVGNGTQRTWIDTTGTDGTAARNVRVRPIGITTVPDSVVVIATVRFRGAAVRGSPVRFVILVRPKPASATR